MSIILFSHFIFLFIFLTLVIPIHTICQNVSLQFGFQSTALAFWRTLCQWPCYQIQLDAVDRFVRSFFIFFYFICHQLRENKQTHIHTHIHSSIYNYIYRIYIHNTHRLKMESIFFFDYIEFACKFIQPAFEKTSVPVFAQLGQTFNVVHVWKV